MLYRPSRTPPVNLDTGDERNKEKNEAAARTTPHSDVGGWKTQAYYATLLFAAKQKVSKNNGGGGDSATKKKKSRSKKSSKEKNWSYSTHNNKKQETEQKCSSRGRNTELEAQA